LLHDHRAAMNRPECVPPFAKGGLGGFAFCPEQRQKLKSPASAAQTPPPFSKGGKSGLRPDFSFIHRIVLSRPECVPPFAKGG
jgi:hypothetical protein